MAKAGEESTGNGAEDEPGGGGFFSGRSVAFWTVIGAIATVLALPIAVLSLFAATGGLPGSTAASSPAPASTSAAQLDAAGQVRACEASHALSSAKVQLQPDVSSKLFASCAWPPPAGADADGYTAISSTIAQGPGESEASGADIVDRVSGPCAVFTLGYTFGSQGTLEHLPTFEVAANTVTALTIGVTPGASADTFVHQLAFVPDRGEVDVVRSGRYALDQASCVR